MVKTKIVAILDASGSMGGLLPSYLEGYNAFIAAQRKEAPNDTLTLVFFDSIGYGRSAETRIRTEFSNKALKDVPILTSEVYRPEGGTPLYDALTSTIDKVGRELATMLEEDRPDKVLFLVQTDGQENSSQEFNKEDVRKRIEHQRSKYKWEFVFLSADASALEDAQDFGISKGNAIAYNANARGARESYDTLSTVTTRFRGS